MTAYETITTELRSATPPAEFGSCALIQDLLPLYIEGEVSPGSRDTIVEHLARCERCAGYMAGAQSMRLQLGRERAQRVAAIVRDQPARHAVSSGRRMMTMLVTLALCGLGAVASVFVAYGSMDYGSAAPMPVGLILGSLCFASLTALAQRGEPFSLTRMVPVSALCAMGGLAAVLLVLVDRGEMKLLGIVLAVIAVVGVWFQIVPERAPAARD